MHGSGTPGFPGGCFGRCLLQVLNVSLNEVVDQGEPETRFSLTESSADDGSVRGALSGVLRFSSSVMEDEGG